MQLNQVKRHFIGNSKTKNTLLIFPAFLLFSFIIFSLFAPIISSNAADSTTKFEVEIKPVLALAAPPELDFGNITPTNAGTFTSKSVDALVATNAIKGYELYFSSKDEATDMLNTNTAISDKITSSFTGTVTNTTMGKNNWGYSMNNTDFIAIPKKSGHRQLRNLTTKPTTDELKTTVHFGTKISTNLTAGNYEKSILFTAVAHANPPKPQGIFKISKMQQMKPEICAKNTTPDRTATQLDTEGYHQGDPSYVPTVTLTDTRDGNTYTISKLADGKCWMTQNLRIVDKTITPADSNVTTNYTIPASSISGFDPGSYGTSNAYINSDSGLYNWYTATAGTGTLALSTDDQNTTASICPKGWRLPTGGNNGEFQALYNNYNSSSALRSNPVNFTLHDLVGLSSHDNQGSNGYYWSSTVDSSSDAYDLYLDTSDVYPADYGFKYLGFSVRCIAEDETRTIHDLANMQEMHPRICVNTTNPNKTATTLDTDGSHHGDPNYIPTKTLVDTRDNNTYTVSKLADGKCWMTQNLRIIDKTLTPADSDVTSNYTIPASSINGFSSNDTSNAYVDSDGGFYNWYTTTAGTGTQSMSSGNTSASICPKGWRLPTGGLVSEFQALYNNYNSLSALRSNPVDLTLSGYVSSSSRYYQGSNGYYWSSTVDSGDFACNLGLYTSSVFPTGSNSKLNGFSVRCIAR